MNIVQADIVIGTGAPIATKTEAEAETEILREIVTGAAEIEIAADTTGVGTETGTTTRTVRLPVEKRRLL